MMRQLATLLVATLCVVAVVGAASGQATYVGSTVCGNCHGKVSNFAGEQWVYWNKTSHPRMILDPDGVIGLLPRADFQAGLDLATDSDFAAFGANAPKLGYDATVGTDSTDETSGYTVTIGAVTYRVDKTLGGWGQGRWKQRFLTKIGGSYYILPIQYNIKSGDWVPYHLGHWYDMTTYLPLYNDPATLVQDINKANSWDRRCSGCHATGNEVTYDETTGEWRASFVEWGIGCEACHGPGSEHAASADPAKIINPEDLPLERALEVCGACHIRGSSVATVGGKTFGFPYHPTEGGFKPGAVLADYYNMVPRTSAKRYWPDELPYGNTSKSHHQQYNDFLLSDHSHYDPAKPWVDVTCFSCHTAHSADAHKHNIIGHMENSHTRGVRIETDNDNNTLCLACHAGHGPFEAITKTQVANIQDPDSLAAVAQVVQQHTHHPYDPENENQTGGASRCSKCHMPKVAKSAIPYDIHAHTFWPMSPEKTLYYVDQGGVPNSCAVSCHRNPTEANVPDFGIVDASLTDWTEPTDTLLAHALVAFYGPGGIWWDTGAPLLVELVSFTAVSGFDYVELQWQTAYESNNYGFEILRSTDGEEFEVIAFVPGSEGTTTGRSYRYRDTDVQLNLTYYYALRQIDRDGRASLSSVVKARVGVVKTYALYQNYPNPFNPETVIAYDVSKPGHVKLEVFNIQGQKVATLVDAYRPVGRFKAVFDASDLPTGVYICRMSVNDFTAVRKLTLMK